MRRAASLLVVLPLLLALPCGCRGHAGHPVLQSWPRLEGPPPPAPALEEPAALHAEQIVAETFRGLEGVLEPLRELAPRAEPGRRTPAFVRLPRMELAVRRRFVAGGFGGAVRSVVALGAVGFVPLAPTAMADLMMQPEVERAVLGAQVLRLLHTEWALPGARREVYWAELLRRGGGPLRFDLRFAFATERRETGSGVVALRYDPLAQPQPEHVTLFRGGCLLEPAEDGGTRVSEILILGTDLVLLPLLQEQLLGQARKTLEDRCTNLWKRAWGT